VRRRWIVFGVVMALLAAVAWQWNSILDHGRGWRSRRLSAAAEESLAKNEIKAAFEQAQSAFYLKPDEPSANRAVARILDARGKPADALQFWRKVVASTQGTREDKMALAEDLLKLGALAETESVVAALRAESPKTPSVLRLAARLAAAQGRLPESIALVNESLDLEPQNADGRLLAASLLAESQHEAERNVAFESFWALSTDPTSAGLRALERLSQWKDLSPDRARELVQRLRERPAPDERLKLLAFDVLLRAQPDQREQFLDEAVANYRGKDADLRRQAGAWLVTRGAPELALSLLPEEESFTRKDLILVHLDALAALGRWKDVRRLLEMRDVPLEEIYRQVFLARSATKDGDTEQANSHWRRARTEAGGDAKRLEYVAEYAARAGELSQAEDAYRALIRSMPVSRPAYDSLLRVVSARKETRAVRDLLAEMRKHFPHDAAIENDLAYFNLLLGENLEEARESTEKLRKAAPGNLAHRTALALALCRLNQPKEALQAYEGLDVPWPHVPPGQRAVRAAAMGMSGDDAGAKAEVSAIALDALWPEERKLVERWVQP
jgi:tetratricopeptide (TPR) repeat protein